MPAAGILRVVIPQMTSRNDRRHRIQRYPKSVVDRAIDETVYGDENVRIFKDLYLGNMTYEEAAEAYHLSTDGLHKRVRRAAGPL